MNPNLHMIFITQQLGTRQQFTLSSADIHTINAPAFFFDREGTASLFRMEGIRLSESELESVFLSTEGWVSAIRLQIISFRESGLLDVSADIERLVETAIWNRLTPEGKDFLLSVSVLDSFTARQAAIMMERETLPEDIEEMLKANDFIRYHPDNGVYIMHGILQDYLRNRFYHHQPESFQRCMLHRAGKSLAADSQYFPAARLFFQIRDYDAILSLPFDVEYLSNQKEEYVLEFIAALAEACPEETLRRYPFVLLAFSIQAYMGGRTEILEKLFRLISEAIETGEGLSPERVRRLKGEFMLTSALCAFNDIKKMDEGFRAAWEILRGPSEMIRSDTSFTFGCPSSLFVFWRESGALETVVQDLDRTLPNYRRLTRGHGAGANSVMRAEVMLMRGEDDEAEIFCHKALYDARSHRQAGICLCAELVLARIAILRGDVDGYFIAVRNIQGYAEKNANLYVLRMVDLCMTAISLVLGRTEGVAQWFSDMESIQKTVYTPVLPYAQTLYSMLLLLQKRYNEFLGISESMLDAARGVGGNICYMLPELYQYKYLAAVHLHQGNAQKAQEYYDWALEMALPDRFPYGDSKTAYFGQRGDRCHSGAQQASGKGGSSDTQCPGNFQVAADAAGAGDRSACQGPAERPRDRRKAVFVGGNRQDGTQERVQQAKRSFQVRADPQEVLARTEEYPETGYVREMRAGYSCTRRSLSRHITARSGRIAESLAGGKADGTRGAVPLRGTVCIRKSNGESANEKSPDRRRFRFHALGHPAAARKAGIHGRGRGGKRGRLHRAI